MRQLELIVYSRNWNAKEYKLLQTVSQYTIFIALEDLCCDHQAVPVREAEQRAAEQVRMDEWIRDLKDSHHSEKEHLLKRRWRRSQLQQWVEPTSVMLTVLYRATEVTWKKSLVV